MPAPAPAAGLPRYVELVRVSSAGQAARDTPEDQRAALDRLRGQRPGVLVERIDEAISGALGTAARGDIQRLFELSKAHAFDEVRVRHVDRLTRHTDPRERFAIYGAVLDAGAVIVDAAGHVIDPSTELGEIDYYLQTWMAAKERRRIIERTRAAKDRLAAAGRLVHGRPPFARTWDKRTGTWGIDDAQAQLYRRLFDRCLAGHSLRRIAGDLNREGIAAPKGGDWTAAHISRLLREPAAVGRYHAHGRDLEIPAIVDADTFRAAGEQLRGNNSLSGPPVKHPALLRKLLSCGVCGFPLYVDKGGKARDRAYYYLCSSGDPACRGYHRVERIDQVVREVVEEWLRRPGTLRAAAELETPEDEGASAEREASEARRELRDLDRQEERVVRLLRRRQISERVGQAQLAEVAQLRAGAERELAAAVARGEAAARRSEVAAELEARVADLREGLGAATPEDWRALLALLFPRTAATGVRLWPDGRIRLLGTVPLDQAGEQALAGRAARKASGGPRSTGRIPGVPVRLVAVAAPRRCPRRS